MGKPRNPPAFPADNEASLNGTMGMSLRDWFAGQWIANHGYTVESGELTAQAEERLAREAYGIADAMLRERER